MAERLLKQPIFLIASERSGSNLARVIHGAHPDIAAPAPPHLLLAFLPLVADYGDLTLDDNLRRLVQDMVEVVDHSLVEWQADLDVEAVMNGVLERSFWGIFDYIYATEAAARGCTRVFFKENETVRFVWPILQAFPDAKFVYLVRDARDVAASFLKSPVHLGNARMSAEVWADEQRVASMVFSQLKSIDRIAGVRYETLITHPEDTVRALCDFLDAPFAEAMLDFHRIDEAKKAKGIRAWKNLHKPIMKSNFGKYRKQLSWAQIWNVERIAHRELQLFGYELEFPRYFLVRFRNVLKVASTLYWLADQSRRGVAFSREEFSLRRARIKQRNEMGRRRRQSRKSMVQPEQILF